MQEMVFVKTLVGRVKAISSLWPVRGEHALITLLTLVIYLTLVAFRSLDDNTLVSWRWVFASVDPNKILLILMCGIVVAYMISKASFIERYPALFLFLVSFAVAALFWRTPEVIVDASRYFTQAKHLETYGITYFFNEWGRGIPAWTDLPLIPLLYGLIFKFLGESRLYIQVFTSLLFSATVVLTYWIGRTLWNESVGFFGGLLLLGIPYIFTQVPLMLIDIPTMFFFTLAIFTFIKALNYGGAGMIMLSSSAIFLTFLSKYSAWLMLSLLVVIFIVYLLEEGRGVSGRQRFLGSAQQRVVFFRGAIVALVSAFLIGAVVLLKFDIILEQIELLLSYQQPGLRRWGESFYSTFFFQIHPFLTIAGAYSAYAAFKKRDLKYAIICWLVFLVFLLQIERIRYIAVLFPMLALMASYGLQEIKNKDLRKLIALCAVASSLVIAIFAYLPFLQDVSAANLKDAGEYLKSTGAQNIEVFALPSKDFTGVNPAVSVPLLDLFTTQPITHHYDQPSLQWEKTKTSSLRFTWEYKNPKYYATNDNLKGNATVVIISRSPNEALPGIIAQRLENYCLSKVLKTSAGTFRHQTIVTIYRPIDAYDKDIP